MTAPNLAEALVALMHETRLAEQHLADRQAVRDAGGDALSALFATPEPEAQVEHVAPASGSSEPASASSGEIDWTETDARIEAARKAQTPAPTPDPAPSVSSEPETDAALLAHLNTPTGETPA